VIRVTCPNCQAKLNAKEELLGQTRRCPRCAGAVTIRPSDEETAFSVDPAERPSQAPVGSPPDDPLDLQAAIAHVETLSRLVRLNRYFICDGTRVIATWENNGQGWRIRADHGFASAARNPEKIPSQGDFKLVEFHMAVVNEELRLKAIQIYQLARRWALTSLGRGDDLICKSIIGPGSLLRAQKDAVRLHLQETIMRSVWGDAAEVLDYLANDDYHSHSAGELSH
jgi:hypothetical protein